MYRRRRLPPVVCYRGNSAEVRLLQRRKCTTSLKAPLSEQPCSRHTERHTFQKGVTGIELLPTNVCARCDHCIEKPLTAIVKSPGFNLCLFTGVRVPSTPEPWQGSSKVNSSSRQWISKVHTRIHIRVEKFHSFVQSGVVAGTRASHKGKSTSVFSLIPRAARGAVAEPVVAAPCFQSPFWHGIISHRLSIPSHRSRHRRHAASEHEASVSQSQTINHVRSTINHKNRHPAARRPFKCGRSPARAASRRRTVKVCLLRHFAHQV